MFFCMVSMVIVLWEVNAILGNGCEIQRQNYVAWLQGSDASRVSLQKFDIRCIVF